MSDVAEVEAFLGKLQCTDTHYVLRSVYRLQERPLQSLIPWMPASDILKVGDKMVVAGDFNLPNINCADILYREMT